jgi:hypothetical protein
VKGAGFSPGVPFLSPPGVPCPYPSLYTTLGEPAFYELRIDGVLRSSALFGNLSCFVP